MPYRNDLRHTREISRDFSLGPSTDGSAIDPTTGAIFCSECDDCVYPDSFESLFRTIKIRVEEEHDTSREGSMLGGGRGRGRGNWRPWDGEQALDMAKASCRGLCRGLS